MTQRQCPTCRAWMPATLQYCGACGARLASPGAPLYVSDAPVSAPRDATERAVSMAWTAFGVLMSAGWVLNLWHEFLLGLPGPGQEPAPREALLLVFGIVVAALLSFLIMRLRRLYIWLPGGAAPANAASKRRQFAIAASVMLCYIIVQPFVSYMALRVREEEERASIRQTGYQSDSDRRAAGLFPYEPPPSSFAPAPAPVPPSPAAQELATQRALAVEAARQRNAAEAQRSAARERESEARAAQEARDSVMPPSPPIDGLGSGPVNPTPPLPQPERSARPVMRGRPGG